MFRPIPADNFSGDKLFPMKYLISILSQTIIIPLLVLGLSYSVLAQDSKPELDFDIQVNSVDEKIEITWFSCLENSIITLLDIEWES